MIIKSVLPAAALALAIASAAVAQTAPAPAPAPASAGPAAPATVGFTTAASTIGEILDNPAAKAVVDAHLPGLLDNERIGQARGLTLKSIQQYLPALTDETLAAIDAGFAKLSTPTAP